MTYRCSHVALWALLIGMAGASPLHAQYMKGETVVSAGAGLQFPTGGFGKSAEGNYSLYGSAEYALNPSWAAGVRASYLKFDATPAARAASDFTGLRYLAGDLYLKLFLYPESWFTPYALGGFGIFRERSWTGSGATEETTDASRLGLTGGFGLSAHRQAARTSVFTEVIYHHLPTDAESQQFVQWAAGIRISFGGRPF